MTVVSGTAAAGTSDAAAAPADGARRPWWVWAVPFTLLFVLLCVRNRFLFTTRLYEQGDEGANSILIEQAKHFTLLVGNYSRERFNHPGPAFMYVQAFGEYLFQNALHAVPTAWNAHMLAVFASGSGFVALGVGVVYGWTRSLRGAAACFAVFTGFAIAYPAIVNSDWMPNMYVLPYMVFVIAAGSVLAGRAQDAWIFALTGWFLIHGRACSCSSSRCSPCSCWRSSCRHPGARCAPPPARSSASSAEPGFRSRSSAPVFSDPILLNLVLDGRATSASTFPMAAPVVRRPQRGAGGGVRAVVLVAAPGRVARAVLGYALASAVASSLATAPCAGSCSSCSPCDAVPRWAFLLYAEAGIDDLSRSTSVFLLVGAVRHPMLVIALAVLEASPPARRGALPPGGVPDHCQPGHRRGRAGRGGGLRGARGDPGRAQASTNDIDEALPRVVATLAARPRASRSCCTSTAGPGCDHRLPRAGGAHRGQGLPRRSVGTPS